MGVDSRIFLFRPRAGMMTARAAPCRARPAFVHDFQRDGVKSGGGRMTSAAVRTANAMKPASEAPCGESPGILRLNRGQRPGGTGEKEMIA